MLIGFLISIAVPKIAILNLGEFNYGVYALITGFAGVLAFSDMGIIPGLTKQLAHPVAVGNLYYVNEILNKVTHLTIRIFIFLSIITSILFYLVKPNLAADDIYAFVLFLLATIIFILSEIKVSVIRVAGYIRESYYLKLLYLITYFLTVLICFSFLNSRAGIWILCFAQLVAATLYFYFCVYILSNKINWFRVSDNKSGDIEPNLSDFWRNMWKISSPERFNRFLQLFVGLVERPLLVLTAGLATVGSYDLLLRITLLVSALPSALNQPLLSMILHDSVRSNETKKFLQAIDLTKILSFILSSLGLLIASVVIVFFHKTIFGVASHIPISIAILIVSVAAINVLTASGSALFVAHGVIWPCNLKIAIELVGTLAAIFFAFYFFDGILFIVIRSLALGVSACVFLVIENRLKVSNK